MIEVLSNEPSNSVYSDDDDLLIISSANSLSQNILNYII